MAHMFVSTNLGESFMSIMEQPLDLTHIVGTEVMSQCLILASIDSICLGTSSWPQPRHTASWLQSPQSQQTPLSGPILQLIISHLPFHLQVKPNTPVLMCSVPGYDASGHVEDLAAEQNTQITSIAIGKGA